MNRDAPYPPNGPNSQTSFPCISLPFPPPAPPPPPRRPTYLLHLGCSNALSPPSTPHFAAPTRWGQSRRTKNVCRKGWQRGGSAGGVGRGLQPISPPPPPPFFFSLSLAGEGEDPPPPNAQSPIPQLAWSNLTSKLLLLLYRRRPPLAPFQASAQENARRERQSGKKGAPAGETGRDGLRGGGRK